MLNKKQQADLDGYRNSVVIRASQHYPKIDIEARGELISMGMAALNMFFKEHPVASAESVMEYLRGRG